MALLFVTRAFYPSEDAETGTGLVWVVLLLGAGGIAIAASLLAGVTRVRWSWVDLAVFALIVLVSLSAGHAADRRPAITMAWEWGGLGLLYGLTRILPRSRGESAALALVVVATGVTLAVYGLYQVPIEITRLRVDYQNNPTAMLAKLQIAPGTPSALAFEKRLMASNEPYSTFGLANSLAGFLVAALVLLVGVGLENLRRDQRSGRWTSLILAVGPGLAILICLLLTKSRSAWVGLVVALAALAWGYRSAIPRRWLLGVGGIIAALVLGLVGAGVASRQLDVQILTEAKKSLGYRWQYWEGAWGIITHAPPPFAPVASSGGLLGTSAAEPVASSSSAFWWGVGPANFAGPYLRHKLPEASEEIQDPHNLIMEVWAESGLFAVLALGASLTLGVARILSPARPALASPRDPSSAHASDAESRCLGGHVWIVIMGGLGWFGVWFLGGLNPLEADESLRRWLILGIVWILAAVLVGPLWNRRPIPALALGAAVIALGVHMLAAGGIGIPSVAMVLWISLALGLNLRDDRRCGEVRTIGGLGPSVVLACGWAVLAGTFLGAVGPAWRADREVALGQQEMARPAPDFEVARNAYLRATEADHYAVVPWLALADLEYRFWTTHKSTDRYKTWWTKVLLSFDKALEANYRDPDSLSIRRQQAAYARAILRQLPDDAQPFELVGLRSTIAKATRQAVRLYPTSASLRAELAQASADLGLFDDAVAEARNALELDRLTPHQDKKLPDEVRASLVARIVEWQARAKLAPPVAPSR